METTLIVGCGYLGGRVAERLRRERHSVLATASRDSSVRALRTRGYQALCLDLDSTPIFTPPRGPYRVLYLAPPPPLGTEDPRIQHLLSTMRTHAPLRLVYASSSSVYGDRRGAWVDETSPIEATTDTAARRLHAERSVTQWCSEHNTSGVVLRIAGIYGPGRLPLERLRAGRPVVREEEAGWSNRIHIDDLVRSCIAALQHPAPQTHYNIADGHPASTTAFLHALADCSGLPQPPEISLHDALAQASPTQARFLRESRKLDIASMRKDLVADLLFPDFSAGLNAALQSS
jgi:nucleoside-diphosphate-sugar epimerase